MPGCKPRASARRSISSTLTLAVCRAVQGVPADNNGPGLLRPVEPQQEVREADDGAPSTLTAYGLGEPVIGAMRERIAVDDQQRSDHSFTGSFAHPFQFCRAANGLFE